MSTAEDIITLRSPTDDAIPLVSNTAKYMDFPMEALPWELANAITAIQTATQAPVEICAQSVLAVVSLATQSLANVRLPTNESKPLSCFFITVAESGERKTAVDRYATKPLKTHRDILRTQYDIDLLKYESDYDIYEYDKDRIKKGPRESGLGSQVLDSARKSNDLQQLKQSLPLEPRRPVLTCSEPTFEGLVKLFGVAQPSLGLFANEGGQFVGGHAMTDEKKLATAAGLSQIWDTGELERVRAGDGDITYFGKRLSMHLMLQPGVAEQLLNDSLFKDQGFLSRLLVSFPKSLIGFREWVKPSAEEDERLTEYGDRILTLLASNPRVTPGKPSELDPPDIVFSDGAEKVFTKYFEYCEKQQAPGGYFDAIRGLANKCPEHAARIAAMFTVYKNTNATEISYEDMDRAVQLTKYYAMESRHISHRASVDAPTLHAHRLSAWLQKYAGETISASFIERGRPRPRTGLRALKKLLQHLVEEGHVKRVPDGTLLKNNQIAKNHYFVVSYGNAGE